MKTAILATLGPSSLNERTIKRLTDLGVSLFRLNLSHTRVADARRLIQLVQDNTSVPLSLDSEGAQVRTGNLVEGTIRLRENSIVRVVQNLAPGDSREFNLYPLDIVHQLEVGDFLSIDSVVLAQVVGAQGEEASLRILTGGQVGQNKAVTVERDIPLPPLTEKDLAILTIGREMGIRHVALSFAHRASDVDAIRDVAGQDVAVISKIECRSGLQNLTEIAQRSDGLLIDRGDLSRQVALEKIPTVQKAIIRRAREVRRPIYVATNLMESMVTEPHPTRAEVNDVYNTLLDGADGLVLAAETAIGRYPIACTAMVRKLIHQFEDASQVGLELESTEPISLLISPHGGRLAHGGSSAGHGQTVATAARLTVDQRTLIECRRLHDGLYSPLTGFLGSADLESVLDRCLLANGTVWPMPVLFQTTRALAEAIHVADRVSLVDDSGVEHAVLKVDEVFEIDVPSVAERWLGTSSVEEPRVAELLTRGPVCLAGRVTLSSVASTAPFHCYLTPNHARFLFMRKGWSRVVGFHTSVLPYAEHEDIQCEALELTHSDGLLITTATGAQHSGEVRPEVVLKSYQLMLEHAVYPDGRVVLGSLPTSEWFGTPREAVLAALCHKNLGCSHFIFARGHGFGATDADAEALRDLFDQLGDIGIQPVFFDGPAYEEDAGLQDVTSNIESSPIPLHGHVRDMVGELLRAEQARGQLVVCD